MTDTNTTKFWLNRRGVNNMLRTARKAVVPEVNWYRGLNNPYFAFTVKSFNF